MSTFRDFLAERARRYSADSPEAIKKRNEWLESLHRLNDQVRGWLESSDPDKLLTIEERDYEIREEGIGRYEAPGLDLILGTATVQLRPYGRRIASPLASQGFPRIVHVYGRVDLTNGLSKYHIYRTEKEPHDRWVLVEEDSYRMREFDRIAFEDALRDLLG